MAGLTPAEKRILELTKRGHEDLTIASTFGTSVAEMRAMREAAEKKLRLQETPSREEYWDR